MDDERIIGELTEFKRATLHGLNKIDSRFDVIDKKIEGLYKFKWKFAGGLSAIVLLIEIGKGLLFYG